MAFHTTDDSMASSPDEQIHQKPQPFNIIGHHVFVLVSSQCPGKYAGIFTRKLMVGKISLRDFSFSERYIRDITEVFVCLF